MSVSKFDFIHAGTSNAYMLYNIYQLKAYMNALEKETLIVLWRYHFTM